MRLPWLSVAVFVVVCGRAFAIPADPAPRSPISMAVMRDPAFALPPITPASPPVQIVSARLKMKIVHPHHHGKKKTAKPVPTQGTLPDASVGSPPPSAEPQPAASPAA
jgi:hypothetical protein